MRRSATERSRITLDLRAGFANQLFQYATARTLADEVGAELVIDTTTISRPLERGDQLQRINLRYRGTRRAIGLAAWRALRIMLGERMFARLSFRLRPPVWPRAVTSVAEAREKLRVHDRVRLAGYLQDTQSARAQRAELTRRLGAAFAPAPGREVGPYAAIHVRRGDYLLEANREKYGLCEIDYYVAGAQRCRSRTGIIISDDPSWCSDVLLPRLGREWSVQASEDLAADFAALLAADELVLSNSTFSWWAAICGRAQVVVAPKPWTIDPKLTPRDIYEPKWRLLGSQDGLE